MEKIVRRVRVKNSMGLHTRPATTIVQLLRTAKCSVHFTYRKETVDAKSVLSILMLAVTKNSFVTITMEGEGAERTMTQLVEIFEKKFGE